ncbi:hypothetical protein [Streptomyces cucumeris]|uniref:hypothetical protein n=1 Tax=Streptomyces cucumeris TaxID=2962890 RepID=UPI003D75E94F
MSSGHSEAPGTRLNQADAGRLGKTNDTLASSPDDKKRAARFMEQHLLPDTQAASIMGEGGGEVHLPLAGLGRPSALKPDTGLTGLSAWATDAGLSEALSAWQGQSNRLLGRLYQERYALTRTKDRFQAQDLLIGTQFSSTDTVPRSSRIDQM